MLAPVWRGEGPVKESDARTELEAARVRARAEIAALPDELRRVEPGSAARKLIASDGLVRQIEQLVAEAG